MAKSRPTVPRVALLIETSRGYGRAMLRGITRYARLHGPWRFYVTPGDFLQALPSMRQWGGTGVIARIESPDVAHAIVAAKLPTIALDISQNFPLEVKGVERFSEIASDSVGAARLAADHLLSRGFKRLAYVGEASRQWSANRERGFVERVREAGLEPMVYRPPQEKTPLKWEQEQSVLAEWLAEIPKPAGVMACNDDRGRQVLDACRAAGIVVPLELAVIGVDNDELLCDLSDPPLSSVELNAEGGGYRAAALLDEMMRGQVRKPQQLVVEPLRVVERRSTDATAVNDVEVAQALEFIHNHASEQIGIDDVVNHVAISRRTLEIRFRDAIGRSPHQELLRVRINRARQLLLETDLSVPKVAAASGFRSGTYLAQVFQASLKATPGEVRRKRLGS